ncbi:MAG TPA: PA14 domain-containing protein [Caldilineaceae bacterium]|nr:PA14 domain-containing protein [Caldilineaceae bacterium]
MKPTTHSTNRSPHDRRHNPLPKGLPGLLVGLFVLLVTSGCAIPIGGILSAQEGMNNVQPSTPIIAIAPEFGVPGTTIAVAGAGWQPTDIVTLKLASSTEPLALEESLTVATVDENGSFTASITFPEAERWRVFPNVLVIAESAQTNVRAVASFEVLPVGLTITPVASEEITPTVTTTPTAAGPTPTWTTSPSGQTPAAATATVPTTPIPIVVSPTASATPIVLGPNQVYVVSPGLNVRSGPGVDYAIIRSVRYGTVLTVLGQSSGGGWLQVQLSDGAIGWVSRYYTSDSVNPPVVQPTITPSATPTSQSTITDWRGEYYTNRYLAGSPALVRNDTVLDFNWGSGSPAAGLPSDDFSVRWTRSPYFDGGRYRFHVRVDDGARLYLDNNLIIDQWNDGSEREFTADRDLGSGNHSLRLEYYEHTSVARIVLWWERISDNNDDDDDYPDWKGEYYDNRNLEDDPRFRRNDDDIDFDWGDGSPDDRISDDNFSVRWTQRVDFDRGRYRFELRADDGIRFYIDGNRVLNEWHENEFRNGYELEFNLDDSHDLTVEYYERRGAARVYVDWDRIGDIVTATPTSTPTNTTTPATPATTTPTATATPVVPTATPTVTPTVVQPSANVQPGNGGPGSTVIVSGGGFPANTTVNVHLGALIGVRSSATNPVSYATTTTDRTGSYSVAFDLPATWPDGSTIASGELLIMVATEDFGAQATTRLSYSSVAPTPTATPVDTATPTATATGVQPPTPTATATPSAPTATATSVPQPFVNLNPTAATAGTLIRVQGGGFPANTAISVYLGIFDGEISPNDSAVSFASTVTDGEGGYSMSFVMPDDTPTGVLIPSGKIAVVVATDGFGLQASATLDFTGVDPTPTAVAASGDRSDSDSDSNSSDSNSSDSDSSSGTDSANDNGTIPPASR